jgi:hypothetical protein
MESILRIALSRTNRDASVKYLYHSLERFLNEGGGIALLNTYEDC